MKITRTRLKELVREAILEDNDYKSFFRKALDKTGKATITSMSDEEKKKFFNKVDAAWKGKGEKSEALTGDQDELDVDGDGDIEADDLADLRKGKTANEAKVNKSKRGVYIQQVADGTWKISANDGRRDFPHTFKDTFDDEKRARKFGDKIAKNYKLKLTTLKSLVNWHGLNKK